MTMRAVPVLCRSKPIERPDWAITSRLDAVMVGWPDAAQDPPRMLQATQLSAGTYQVTRSHSGDANTSPSVSQRRCSRYKEGYAKLSLKK